MSGFAIHEDITLASRYECKYLMSPLALPALRRFIRPFARPDPYAALHEDHRYPICSLYLDSEDLRLYQQTVCGEKDRFKLRVRSYSDDPETPVYFEVKRKLNNVVRKRRTWLSRDEARDWLRTGAPRQANGVWGERGTEVDYFWNRQSMTAARPVVRVKYYREAYESRGGDPVRVTIDTDLMHVVTFDDNLGHAEGRWVRTPVQGAILELKFTNRFPSWIHELVRNFGLKQQAVPKYGMSVDHMLLNGRESALSIAGFVLPPWRA